MDQNDHANQMSPQQGMGRYLRQQENDMDQNDHANQGSLGQHGLGRLRDDNQPRDLALGNSKGFAITGAVAPLFMALAMAQAAYGKVERTKKVTVRNEKANYDFWYAPLENVLGAVMGALNGQELALLQPLYQEGSDWKLRTILAHSSGATLECLSTIPWPVRRWYDKPSESWKESKGSWQEFGSAVTYARRYTIGCFLGIAPEEDDDGTGAEDMPRQTETRGPRQNTQPTPPAAPQKAQPANEAPKAKAEQASPRAAAQNPGGPERQAGPLSAKQPTLDEASKVLELSVEAARPTTAKEYVSHELAKPLDADRADDATGPAEPKLTSRISPITDAQNAKAMELFSSRVWPRKNMEAGTIDPTVCDTREKRLLYLREVWNISDPNTQLTSEYQMAQVLASLEKLPTKGPA